MSFAKNLLSELKQETANTRKLLALVPFEKAAYRPHEKSMTLIQLASHVAEINGWWKECLLQDQLDFAKDSRARKEYHSTNDIVALHDELVSKAEQILNDTADEEFAKPWTMRNGNQIYFTLPKAAVVRTWCLNHLCHHRGQLTVYLRLLNVPIPGMYSS
jgi:uncharacterized damage-inducible protein DinB